MIRKVLSVLLCFSILSTTTMAADIPPFVGLQPPPNPIADAGHIGLTSPPEPEAEEESVPDYNCSLGCAHDLKEPHNYVPFNIYGDGKTQYLNKGRAAIITVDLTDAGAAGSAPLKCLTQYERDNNQHWERCINHPGTGTYNGLYHNAGRINLVNHQLNMSGGGVIDCYSTQSRPKKVCASPTCGFSRELAYVDFPLVFNGKTYVWDDLLHEIYPDFYNNQSTLASWYSIRHLLVCKKCGAWDATQSLRTGKSYCEGKPQQLHQMSGTTGRCILCGDRTSYHSIGKEGWVPDVYPGHGNFALQCTLCPIVYHASEIHDSSGFCTLCGITILDTHEHVQVSGAPNAPGGVNYRLTLNYKPGYRATKIGDAQYVQYLTENGATIPGRDVSHEASISPDQSTVTVLYNIPYNPDKRHQNTYPFYLHINVQGMSPDGRLFSDTYNMHKWDKPDGIAPYGGTAVPQNGTPSAWRDTVDVVVAGKDDWSDRLVFTIYDSDKTTQLGAPFTASTRDAAGNFNATFKLIAEASAPKSIYLRATDICGNYQDFGFQVQYVDTYAPRIQAAAVDNNTWTRSKTVRFSSIEGGSRETKMSFNDGTRWSNCEASGDTYYQDYIFTGDVYTPQTRPIFFKDKLNNTNQAMFTISRLDNTKPTISSVTATANSIKTASTISVNANDSKAGLGEGSGVKSYALTKTNVQPSSGWQNSSQFTVTVNGTYYLWVKDGVNWVSNSAAVTVSDIDVIPPTFSVTAPSNWTNQDVTITLTASDAQSGLSTITSADGTYWYTSPSYFTAIANGNYSFIATDRAGNTTTKAINITCIDRVAPTLSLSASPNWTYNDVDIQIEAGDDYSGVARTVLPDGTSKTEASFTYTVSKNGAYEFKTYDKAGNLTTKRVVITSIDRVNPLLTLFADTKWTNTSVDIVSTVSDDYSGVFKTTLPDNITKSDLINTYNVTANGTYNYSVQDNAGNITRDRIVISCLDFVLPSILLTAPTDWTNSPFDISVSADDDYSGVQKIKKPDGTHTTNINDTFSVSQNGTYSFTVYDKAGNEKTESIEVSNFDYIKPTIAVSAPTEWTNKPVDITVQTGDDYSGVNTLTLPDGTSAGPTTTTYRVSQNGVYSFTVYDKAGNSETTSITITCFDYVLPEAVPSNLPTDWLLRPHEITVTASDDYSGVKRIKTPDGEWHETNEVKVFVFENKDFIFEIEDNASNVFTLTVPINYVENTNPEIELSGNSAEWTNQDIRIRAKATDPQSGVRGISLNDKNWEFVDTIDYLFTGNGSHEVIAEDNVGHRSAVPLVIDKIDKDLPTATYVAEPSGWTKGDVKVTITAEDKLSGLVGKAQQVITVSSNGTTGLQISDKAGNVLELPVKVTNIDKDNPTIDGIGIAAVSRGQAPLTIVASDQTSPIVKIEYQLVGLESELTDQWLEYSEGVKVTAPFHGDVATRCYDSAGNVSPILRKEFMIDPIPPRAKSRMSTLAYTQEPITIFYSAADMESGFNYTILPDKIITTEPEVEYTAETNGNYNFKSYDYAGNSTETKIRVTNLDKDPPSGTVIEDPSTWTNGNVNLTLVALDASKIIKEEPINQTATDNGVYTFYLEDEHGNKVNLSHTVDNIDRLAPSIYGSARNFLATIRVEDLQSGVKSIQTPLGSSASSVLMFNVSPSTTYNISAVDNAGNTSNATLYVNSVGEGSTDGPVPDPPSIPDKPSGDGNDSVDISSPREESSNRDGNVGDYDYGKPNKDYPNGTNPSIPGQVEAPVTSPSSSASSTTSSKVPKPAPHIGFASNKPKDREDTKIILPEPPPKTVIILSGNEPTSVFNLGEYTEVFKQLGEQLNLRLPKAFWISATIMVIWALWLLLIFFIWLKELRKRKDDNIEGDNGSEGNGGDDENEELQ